MVRKITGIVLAGGMSIRFGSPKAFAEKEGVPFYQYSIKALQPVTDRIIMVTNSKLEDKFRNEVENFDIIKDEEEFQGQGPLAGLFTAMNTITSDWYIVLPIDVPFIEGAVIRLLMENLEEKIDAVVPVVSGKIQPLIAIYRNTAKEIIKYQLDNNNLSVNQMLNHCDVKYVTIKEDKPFYNINHKEEYQKWIENVDNI